MSQLNKLRPAEVVFLDIHVHMNSYRADEMLVSERLLEGT